MGVTKWALDREQTQGEGARSLIGDWTVSRNEEWGSLSGDWTVSRHREWGKVTYWGLGSKYKRGGV